MFTVLKSFNDAHSAVYWLSQNRIEGASIEMTGTLKSMGIVAMPSGNYHVVLKASYNLDRPKNGNAGANRAHTELVDGIAKMFNLGTPEGNPSDNEEGEGTTDPTNVPNTKQASLSDIITKAVMEALKSDNKYTEEEIAAMRGANPLHPYGGEQAQEAAMDALADHRERVAAAAADKPPSQDADTSAAATSTND